MAELDMLFDWGEIGKGSNRHDGGKAQI